MGPMTNRFLHSTKKIGCWTVPLSRNVFSLFPTTPPPPLQRILPLIYKLLALIFAVDNFNIYPNTRLGKLVKAKKVEDIMDLCDDYCPGQPPEFFFDRSWHSFNSILDVYRTGLLHLNNDMCALVLQVRLLCSTVGEALGLQVRLLHSR